MDHLTTCIMFVGTGVLFYVWQPMWYTAAGNTTELTRMDHMTTCIMSVSTGVLFYDCSNVLFAHVCFPVWRVGNHLLRPFSKIVARIQYFGRNCNPETNPNVREVFTLVTMKTVVGCDITQSGRSLQSLCLLSIFRATLCNWQCNAWVFLSPVPPLGLLFKGIQAT